MWFQLTFSADNVIKASWPNLNSKFRVAQTKLEEAVKYVNALASHAKNNPGPENQSQDADFAAILGLNEESAATFPCHSVPPANPYFRCRTHELQSVNKFFQGQLFAHELRSFVLFGLGGVGKTALILAHVKSCIEEKRYDAIFLVQSQSLATLRESMTTIAMRLELPRADRNADKDNNVVIVKNWLSKTCKRLLAQKTNLTNYLNKSVAKTWLLIFDNVDDIEIVGPFLPMQGNIIITTRYKEQAMKVPGHSMRLELDKFTDLEAREVFNTFRLQYNTQPEPPDLNADEESIKVLLKLLDGHALGIEQMAAYIQYRNISTKQFLSQYEKKSMSRRIHKSKDGMASPHSLATLWGIQFEGISGTTASKLLGLLSLLSPSGIPMDLFVVDEDLQLETPYNELCKDEAE